MKYLVLPLLLATSTAMASPCTYEKDVNSVHIKKIESTRVMNRSISMMNDSMMRCSVDIESMVDGKTYRQQDSFVFDLFSMNADEGCGRALSRAKERVYHRASPELFRSSTTMKCSAKRKVEKKGIFFNVLPYSLMGYGEHREVVLRPHCSVVAGTVTYKEGYTLHGYKEVCDETR